MPKSINIPRRQIRDLQKSANGIDAHADKLMRLNWNSSRIAVAVLRLREAIILVKQEQDAINEANPILCNQ